MFPDKTCSLWPHSAKVPSGVSIQTLKTVSGKRVLPLSQDSAVGVKQKLSPAGQKTPFVRKVLTCPWFARPHAFWVT